MRVPPSHAIRLLLVDSHAMFREGLARILEAQPDFAIAGQTGSVGEALAVLARGGVSAVLADVELGQLRAPDFIAAARAQGFAGPILIVTAGTSGDEAVSLVQAGVAGILHKHHSGEVLCRTIRQIAAGQVHLEEQYLAPLFRSVDRSRTSLEHRQLDDRDRKLLRLVVQGLSNREIGAQLEVTEGAIKAALHRVFRKLGVRTRAQLVKVALDQHRDQL